MHLRYGIPVSSRFRPISSDMLIAATRHTAPNSCRGVSLDGHVQCQAVGSAVAPTQTRISHSEGTSTSFKPERPTPPARTRFTGSESVRRASPTLTLKDVLGTHDRTEGYACNEVVSGSSALLHWSDARILVAAGRHAAQLRARPTASSSDSLTPRSQRF